MTKPMTPAMARLIADATAAGWTVVEELGTIKIRKQKEKRTSVGSNWLGLIIYGDGTACDLSVPHERQRFIRGYKAFRAILGLDEAK